MRTDIMGDPAVRAPTVPAVLPISKPTKTPILMVGLPPDHPSLVGKIPAAEVATGLRNVQAQFDASSEYSLHQYLTSPEEPIEDYIATLKARPWKGILIGFGIRGLAEHTDFFEVLVNLAHEHCPTAKFCFNAGLPTSLRSVQKNVPVDVTEVVVQEEGSKEKRKSWVWRKLVSK